MTKEELLEKFWAFTKKADWIKDKDYNRVAELIESEEQRQELDQAYGQLSSDLYVKFKKDWLEDPGIPVSDDGWTDLRSTVIARGQEFYENVTAEKLRKMAIAGNYWENYGYSFHKK